MLKRSWSFSVLLLAVTMCGLCEARDQFPIGAVVGPAGGSAVPSTQQQRLHYDWLRRTGFDIIEHEVLPLAGGWLAWANIQPEPDRYDWDAYDSAVADTQNAGLTVLLEVFTWNNVPAWIFEAHPDAYMQTPLSGANELTRVIRDEKLDTPTWPSLAHPDVLEAACNYVRRMAERYRENECVKGYIIGEEAGLSAIWPPATYYGIDFSPAMRDAYHAHLKTQYKTVQELNKAWKCPGRYSDFSQIKWSRDWAYDPANYRGEWLEYYQTLQQVFAEFHNALARSIHQGDPDALVMVSGYTLIASNRVGHGGYLPLFKDVDAVAYKSYWHDNRTFLDYSKSMTSGKEVWCSNLSERETTTGPVEKQRFLEPRYIRRQLWAGFSHGLDGVFVWVWAPPRHPGLDKMNVLMGMPDGSIETIPALADVRDFRAFMRQWWPYLKQFQPKSPKVILLDANLTFIGQFWDNTDPTPVRAASRVSNANERYTTMLNLLTQCSRSFAVGTEQTIEKLLADKSALVFSMTGCDNLTREMTDLAHEWAKAGKALVIDDQSGSCSLLGVHTDALANLDNADNVLVLRGDRWDRKKDQKQRLREFLDRNAPPDYKTEDIKQLDTVSVDMMTSPNGDEMAVITRNGPMGRLEDTLKLSIEFARSHRNYLVIDPFAAVGTGRTHSTIPGGLTADCLLPGYQDVMLVVGVNSMPSAIASQ